MGGREVNIINILSKNDLSKLGEEGGGQPQFGQCQQIYCFFDVIPYTKYLDCARIWESCNIPYWTSQIWRSSRSRSTFHPSLYRQTDSNRSQDSGLWCCASRGSYQGRVTLKAFFLRQHLDTFTFETSFIVKHQTSNYWTKPYQMSWNSYQT